MFSTSIWVAAMTEVILEVHSLHSGYGAGDILQGVDLRVIAGEIVAIVGRNGAGKTTLMRTIMGLVDVGQGHISFCGTEITGTLTEDRARAGLGYVPQGKLIFPHLTVAENLRMGTRVGGGKEGNRARVFEYFPVLEQRANQKGGTLSGGEQQALAIARALFGQPKILLLDEPSESIQPSIIEEMGEVLIRLNRETGLTMVLVEQNLGLITAVAQRGYVLNDGRITTTLSRSDMGAREVMLKHLSV